MLPLARTRIKKKMEDRIAFHRNRSLPMRRDCYTAIDEADGEIIRENWKKGPKKTARISVGPEKKRVEAALYEVYERGDRPVYYYGLLKYSLDCILVDHKDAAITKANIAKAVTTFLNADPKRLEMTRAALEFEIIQHFELDIPVLLEYLDELFAEKSPAPAVQNAVPATVAVPSGVAVAADEANQPNNAEKLISMMAEQNIKSNAVQHQQNQQFHEQFHEQNQQFHEQNQQTTRNINQLTSNIASNAASIAALREHSVAQDARMDGQDARLNDQDARIDGIAVETTVNRHQIRQLFKSQIHLGQVVAESSQQVAESAQKIASLKEQVDASSTAKKLNGESPSPDRKRKALPGLQQRSAIRRSAPSVTFTPSTRFPPISAAEASSLPGSGIAAMPGSGASSTPLGLDMLAAPSPALFIASFFPGLWSSAQRAAALLENVGAEELESSSDDDGEDKDE